MLIKLESLGDYWINWFSVTRQIMRAPADSRIDLDKQYEGWCLTQSGFIRLLQKIQEKKPDLRGKIRVINDSNHIKPPGSIACLSTHKVSHFFSMSSSYDSPEIIDRSESLNNRFGYFVGRPTLPRMKFFYDLQQRGWGAQFVLSKMQDDCRGKYLWREQQYHLDRPSDWFDDSKSFREFEQWLENDFTVTSLDGSHIDDQFSEHSLTNINLAKISCRWAIELVFETCTTGQSFFPTEKTIRPMICKKPFLIYGPANFLKNLHDLGFRTFGDFWDESYDNFCQKPRYDRLIESINSIIMLTDNEFENVMRACCDITEHNRRVARKLSAIR